MIPHRQKQVLDRFIRDLQQVAGERLVSVAAYGSVLTTQFKPSDSDINLIVVIEDLTADDLLRLRRRSWLWCRWRSIRPVFFTPAFVKQSADVFPIEWREISLRHTVLYGADLFSSMSPGREHLRLQLEREIKQNWLAYAQALASGSEIREALRRSVKSMEVSLRNAVEILGRPPAEPPVRMEDLQKHPGRPRLRQMTADHLAFLEKIVQWCDTVEGKNREDA